MSIGMKAGKIAVSLPDALLRRARGAVRRGRAPSMSSYVAAALEEKVKLDDLAELLDTMLAETGGPLTAAERRSADAVLDSGPRQSRRKRP
jgi:Arc/MetJ-type ribon-helix-helix transcriptional regulator